MYYFNPFLKCTFPRQWLIHSVVRPSPPSTPRPLPSCETETLCPPTTPHPCPLGPDPTNLLTTLGALDKRNPAVFVFFHPVYFMEHNALKIHSHSVCQNLLLLKAKYYSIVCKRHILSIYQWTFGSLRIQMFYRVNIYFKF